MQKDRISIKFICDYHGAVTSVSFTVFLGPDTELSVFNCVLNVRK